VTLSERLARVREHSAVDPCFCEGPWYDLSPEERPDSILAREHETGQNGCTYRLLAERPEWLRRGTFRRDHTDRTAY
jgi:hypothetical protein